MKILALIIIFLLIPIIAYSAPVEITIDYGNETCTENWSCGYWSSCVSGTQTRTCTDSNNCGTTFNKSATQSCTSGTPSGPGGPSNSGVTPSNKNVSSSPKQNIPPQPQIKESPYVKLELTTIDEIEAGEPFIANVTISSTKPIDTTIELFDKKQNVSLKAGESKTLSFEIYAPETEGYYNLVAVTPDATGNKTIHLIYKPLFLYVTPMGNQTYEIHLKNFDNSSTTEIEVVRDNAQTVYLDMMEGKKDYKVNLTFSNPGEYVVKAKTTSGFNILDEDVRKFKIEGKPEINYGLLALIVILIIILIGSVLIFKELRR